MIFADYSALEDCQNVEHSYGEICVKCNKCGRFNKEAEGDKENE